jgi:hypothetical protein
MFWETPWAPALGFGLSGAVQAFVYTDPETTAVR